MPRSIHHFLAEDLRRLEDLLARAIAGPGELDLNAYREFRAWLLRTARWRGFDREMRMVNKSDMCVLTTRLSICSSAAQQDGKEGAVQLIFGLSKLALATSCLDNKSSSRAE